MEIIEYYLLGSVYLAAIMSPGPSSAVIMKNSINYSYRHGIATSLGTIMGVSLQALIVLIGFCFISHYQYLCCFIGIFLSFYLFYIGIKNIIFLKNKRKKDMKNFFLKNKKYRLSQSFQEGFFVDILNPLALSFFLAIFSSYINPSNGWLIHLFCWMEIIILGALWYIGFAILISINFFQKFVFIKLENTLNIAISIIILILAIKLFLENFSLGYKALGFI